MRGAEVGRVVVEVEVEAGVEGFETMTIQLSVWTSVWKVTKTTILALNGDIVGIRDTVDQTDLRVVSIR